ncbi:hypothetical protein JJJ17_18600 [Paracoccus caeni]|uniref:Uncharacterized protein n=1 Tax=Paracoccus caeni TaxID=657651 RepID=A0A934SHV4_9RHOB|nr:hypothetical protein [Paracoccus caeni]MBK4217943.1 hypothetical protein [Paracoccus caeni]
MTDDITLPALTADARDHMAALIELLDLMFWAAEGIGDLQGAAMARGAMLARERAERLRELLAAISGSAQAASGADDGAVDAQGP